MNFNFYLSCNLNIPPKRFVRALDKLEVRLPCINCKRMNRTIIFEELGAKGICTPRKKCNGFSGYFTKMDVEENLNSVQIHFKIEFLYQNFFDSQYKSLCFLDLGGFSSSPNWARISFILKCENCEKELKITTQENKVRPPKFIRDECNCRALQYIENVSPFHYRIEKSINQISTNFGTKEIINRINLFNRTSYMIPQPKEIYYKESNQLRLIFLGKDEIHGDIINFWISILNKKNKDKIPNLRPLWVEKIKEVAKSYHYEKETDWNSDELKILIHKVNQLKLYSIDLKLKDFYQITNIKDEIKYLVDFGETYLLYDWDGK